MRISTSDNYHREGKCDIFDECQRNYCNTHRLLFRSCDTAYKDSEGDGDVVNGTRTFWASEGECPSCVQDSRSRRLKKEQEAPHVH